MQVGAPLFSLGKTRRPRLGGGSNVHRCPNGHCPNVHWFILAPAQMCTSAHMSYCTFVHWCICATAQMRTAQPGTCTLEHCTNVQVPGRCTFEHYCTKGHTILSGALRSLLRPSEGYACLYTRKDSTSICHVLAQILQMPICLVPLPMPLAYGANVLSSIPYGFREVWA